MTQADMPAPMRRTRSYDYAVGGLNLEAAMRLTGLEYMQALVAGEFGDKPSITDTIGMSIPHSLGYGTASVDAEPGDWLLNPAGAVHGGFAATILDSVMGLAVHTAQPAGVGYATSDLKVTYTRPILPGMGLLRATGTLVHAGRQMASAEGRLIGVEDGKLYAHGAATCMMFPLARPADRRSAA
ncbi:MAG: PaaI family thioesterase [Pseudomonadota bacterium]|nr:PaaI family thioesterase [Pseudomonadota bacterium]